MFCDSQQLFIFSFDSIPAKFAEYNHTLRKSESDFVDKSTLTTSFTLSAIISLTNDVSF